jgi:hypothetical protein
MTSHFQLIKFHEEEKKMKKLLCLLIVFSLLISFSTTPNPSSVKAQSAQIEEINSEEEFMELVRNSEYYKELSEKYQLEEPVVKEEFLKDGETIQSLGWSARYEFNYKEEEQKAKGELIMKSQLVFIYHSYDKYLSVDIVDYSDMPQKGIVRIVNLIDDSVTTFDVSKENWFHNFKKELKKKYKDAKKKAAEYAKRIEKQNSNTTEQAGNSSNGVEAQAEPMCWWCTSYETHGGELDGLCSYIGGSICSLLAKGKKALAGYIMCNGGVLLACWVPEYKYCVDGIYGRCATQ